MVRPLKKDTFFICVFPKAGTKVMEIGSRATTFGKQETEQDPGVCAKVQNAVIVACTVVKYIINKVGTILMMVGFGAKLQNAVYIVAGTMVKNVIKMIAVNPVVEAVIAYVDDTILMRLVRRIMSAVKSMVTLVVYLLFTLVIVTMMAAIIVTYSDMTENEGDTRSDTIENEDDTGAGTNWKMLVTMLGLIGTIVLIDVTGTDIIVMEAFIRVRDRVDGSGLGIVVMKVVNRAATIIIEIVNKAMAKEVGTSAGTEVKGAVTRSKEVGTGADTRKMQTDTAIGSKMIEAPEAGTSAGAKAKVEKRNKVKQEEKIMKVDLNKIKVEKNNVKKESNKGTKSKRNALSKEKKVDPNNAKK